CGVHCLSSIGGPMRLHLSILLVSSAMAFPACGGSVAPPIESAVEAAQSLDAGVPRASWGRLDAPAAASQPAAVGGAGAASAGACGPVGPATLGAITAHVSGDANGLTDSLLSLVDRITHERPTAAAPDRASWGPWGDPGESVVHRF